MAHLSCVGATREELNGMLDAIAGAGIDNVLALRGDPPRGETEWRPHPGGLHYSTELAALIAERRGFGIGAACRLQTEGDAFVRAPHLGRGAMRLDRRALPGLRVRRLNVRERETPRRALRLARPRD